MPAPPRAFRVDRPVWRPRCIHRSMAGEVAAMPTAPLLLLLVLLVCSAWNALPCSGAHTSYEVVKSGLYPRFPAGLKPFRDRPVHGPVVAVEVWHSSSKVLGIRTAFLDGFKSPVHGYAAGNTSTVTYDPNHNYFLTLAVVSFRSTSSKGTTGVPTLVLLAGNRTLTSSTTLPRPEARFQVNVQDPATVLYGQPNPVLGFKGEVDDTGIAQLGAVIEARTLSYSRRTSPGRTLPLWPRSAVTRSTARPRLAPGLQPFDDGDRGEHGEVVALQVWASPAEGVLGVQSTFQDGHRSPVHGSARGPSATLAFDPATNPLIAIGARGYIGGGAERDYRLGAIVTFAGGSSPPTRSPVLGFQVGRTYADSGDGRVVGLFGQISVSGGSGSYVAQIGAHFVSPVSGQVVSSGPYPRVSPPATTVPFDHTGDNLGVSQIDVFYSDVVGVRGLRFTYVSRLGVPYTTPVYGQPAGRLQRLRFDYVDNPLVNVVVFVANVLNGKGEVGVIGLNFHTLKGDFVGTFGITNVDYNLTDGSRRVVGFHGGADTILNSLGVYTAPI